MTHIQPTNFKAIPQFTIAEKVFANAVVIAEIFLNLLKQTEIFLGTSNQARSGSSAAALIKLGDAITHLEMAIRFAAVSVMVVALIRIDENISKFEKIARGEKLARARKTTVLLLAGLTTIWLLAVNALGLEEERPHQGSLLTHSPVLVASAVFIRGIVHVLNKVVGGGQNNRNQTHQANSQESTERSEIISTQYGSPVTTPAQEPHVSASSNLFTPGQQLHAQQSSSSFADARHQPIHEKNDQGFFKARIHSPRLGSKQFAA